MAETLIVIPARFESSRFPGKPLVDILGKSMIQRVVEQCSMVKNAEVCVATDDKRIEDHLKTMGVKVFMTHKNHQSGTDRVAEVAKSSEHTLIINVQGDEPCIDPAQIQQVHQLLKDGAQIATLRKAIGVKEALDANTVKVVCSQNHQALYFSRSVIPYHRSEQAHYYKHIGIYGFQRDVLLEVSSLKSSQLEKTESLEQLRWLEHGYAIQCDNTEIETPSVDSPQDIERVVAFLNSET